ncbi:MAG: kelch repeat-containing protein [Thermoanaerobaculia bacterium]
MFRFILLTIFISQFLYPADQFKKLSLEERAKYKMKIEEVYQRIRTEGKNSSLPDLNFFKQEAEKDLKYSNALKIYFNFEIKQENLQAELERMAKNSKQPEVLRKIFEALNNDPELIAEVFVRSILSRRLLENYYYNDYRMHKEWKENILKEIENVKIALDLKYLSGNYSERIIWRENKKWAHPSISTVNLNNQEFEDFLGKLEKKFLKPSYYQKDRRDILEPGAVSRIIEDREGITVIGVLDRGKDYIKIGVIHWQKKKFHKWWKEVQNSIPSSMELKSASFQMPNLRTDGCRDDSWYALPGPPDGRYGFASANLNGKFVVWGGRNGEEVLLNTGMIYDASSDSWTEISSENAPTPRESFAYESYLNILYIFGGKDAQNNYLNTGAYYNATTDTWTAMNQTGDVPTPRCGATAFYNVQALYVFGGENESGTKLGDVYFYLNNRWYQSTLSNPPSPRSDAKAVSFGYYSVIFGGKGPGNVPLGDGKYLEYGIGWRNFTNPPPAGNARYEHTMVAYNNKVLIWGGIGSSGFLNTGIYYDFNTGNWTTMSSSGLAPRYGHTAVASGGYMYIFGGTNDQQYFGDGAKYDISNNTWSSMNFQLEERAFHGAVSTYSYMVIWGGKNMKDVLGSGAKFDFSNQTWTPTYDGGAPTPRSLSSYVSTGTEVFVFSGEYFGEILNNGKKYIPATDTWESIAELEGLTPRITNAFHYWTTGNKLIFWGGYDENYSYLNDGALYDISYDTWEIMGSTDPDIPSPRAEFATAWDPVNEKMYVWGGYINEDPYYANDGAIYDPGLDSWEPIPTTGAPSARAYASGVWTGSKFIVWGGEEGSSGGTVNTGGIYEPGTGWSETNTTDVDLPGARALHAVAYDSDVGMIIWGGTYWDYATWWDYNDGAIYNPSNDNWTSLPAANLDERSMLAFASNGRDFFVWGGYGADYYKDGARYYIEGNNFSPTSLENAPEKRSHLSSLWTGKYFFIWGGGGYRYPESGALYCSCLTSPPQSSNPSPPNGGRTCSGRTTYFTCENAEANNFDIYIDNNLECSDSSTCSCSKQLENGSHTWYAVSENHCGEASGTLPVWTFDVISPPQQASNPNPPHLGVICQTDEITFQWTADSGSEKFDVYLNGLLKCSDITQPSCYVGIFSSAVMQWYVVSKNACETVGPTWTLYQDQQKPLNFSLSSPANGSSVCPDQDLYWNYSTYARWYDVYLDGDKKCSDITDNTCEPGTISSGSHSWYVLAKNGCGNTSSSTWTFSIKEAPGDASNPNPYNGQEICGLSPTLTFDPAPNATLYDVYVDNELKCADITSPSCSPGSLSVGEHTWYVVAKNGCAGQENQSDTWIFYIDESSPGEATNIFPPDGSYVCPNPTLDWDPAPNARKYDIYIDDNLYPSCTNIPRTYCNTNITSGTHTWKIVSKNNCGNTPTPASGTFSFSILSVPSQPTVQDKDICALSGVEITWGSVPGATGYDLMVDGTTIIQNVISPYTYEPGNSSSHTYQIRAKNTYCTTSWSTSSSGIDDNQTPSTPSITSIQDVDACAQSGIKIYYDAGSPATRHDLYRNGVKVVEGYTSGATYNPGSTSNYTYYIKAINGTCTKDSSTQDFADANNTPTPTISGANQNTCPDEFVLLSTQSGMTDYQWYRNGQIISGANSYQHSATLSGAYTVYYKNSYGCGNTSSGHSVTINPCYGPEPVADGKLYGTGAKFQKASDFDTTGNIEVTFDSTTCSSDHISILYGNLTGENNFDGYDGCALANGGSSGSTTFNSTGQDNVWYNIIWVSNTGRAGHPGYYYQNGEDLQRNWSALGFCSITSEMQNDPSCNGVPGP